MVFANSASMIVHHASCEFHPAEYNLVIYDELYQALADGYSECRICYGPGFPIGKHYCNQCGVYCSTWQECEHLAWVGDQAYCIASYPPWG